MNAVKFSYGLLSDYNALETKDMNTIYFITDKPYIYYKDARYGGTDLSEVKTVSDVVFEDNTITVKYSDGSEDSVFELQVATKDSAGLMSAVDKAKLDNLSDELQANVMYDSALDDSIAMVEAHGGLPAGTTAGELKTKTLSQVFDEVLFPTVYPTFTSPSASLSLKNTTATPTLQEVGAVGASVPTEASFNASFNPGAISIAGVKKQDRAGALNSASSFIYINEISNKVFPTSIPEGSTTYKYRASYAQGPQPLDSKGANYGTPLVAGTVDSGAVTINGVYPYYANKVNSTSEKLPLTVSTTINIAFAAEGPNKHTFKLPSKYTLMKVEMLNTLSGKYENFGVDKWAVSLENIPVQGISTEYTVYTRKDTGFSGEATFNITFSK